jgi:Holliday junction resolvasome RuvABC ATP-dependent DNA helicase subunit
MVSDITDFYVNGIFQKRVVKTKPDEVIEPVGEIINFPKFEDMVYEENVKDAINLILTRIKSGKINILLYGSAGTGKTATAQMFAVETTRPFIYLTGTQGTKKILKMLINAKENAIALIDEIHNLPEKVAEIIYPAIQDGEIYSEGKKIKLKNIMFVGTTTEPEKLPKPLLDRFQMIEFEELSPEKMKEVLIKKGCDKYVVDYLLNFTSNFRIINNLLEMIKMYGEINEMNLRKVFRLKKINLYSGLSDYQEKYLDILKKSDKPVGLRTIGLQLMKGEDYIKYEIEPDLVRKKMIVVTSRGRELEPSMKDYGYSQLKKESEKIHSKFTEEDRRMAISWLKEQKQITEALGKRYLEVVSSVAEMIHNGEIPDGVDWGSYADDIPVKQSMENNRGILEEL